MNINQIIAAATRRRKAAEQQAKEQAKEQAAADKAAADKAKAAARAKAAAAFPTMSGVLVITTGHYSYGPKDCSDRRTSVAVRLHCGKVIEATALEHYDYYHISADRAWGVKERSERLSFKALHTPKADAVFTCDTHDNPQANIHEYRFGETWIGSEAMKDKVAEILADPIVVAAIEAAKAAAKQG